MQLTDDMRYAAPRWGVSEEWAMEHYEEFKEVYEVFSKIRKRVKAALFQLNLTYKDFFTGTSNLLWIEFNVGHYCDIVVLIELLEEYSKWFTPEPEGFDYYQELAKEYISEWHEN